MAKTPAQPGNVEKLLYRHAEAAYALGCSVRRIDYLIEQGKLTTRKFGRSTVIPAADVKRLANDILKDRF